MKNLLITIALALICSFANSAKAQNLDLKDLNQEIQIQIQVARDLSLLVQKTLEQNQSEGALNHYDYWLKKKNLATQLTQGLVEYEAYLQTHLDPIKPLFTRFNFVLVSDQYSAEQKIILIKDIVEEARMLIETQLQPKKHKAYLKLLSHISPLLPMRVKDWTLTKYVLAGEPESIKTGTLNHHNPNDVNKFRIKEAHELFLLDLFKDCYSQTCFKLYQSDIINLISQLQETLPSWIEIDFAQLAQNPKAIRAMLKEESKVSSYPGTSLSTNLQIFFKEAKTSEFYYRDLPYALSEQEYLSNREKLIRQNLVNRASVEKSVNLYSNISAMREFFRCDDKIKLNQKLIEQIVKANCSQHLPEGQYCLNTASNIQVFTETFVFPFEYKTYACSNNFYEFRKRVVQMIQKIKW
ncbi:MAG: hypothetical protein AB7F59_06735 [Bdellovibrionales bacterium]